MEEEKHVIAPAKRPTRRVNTTPWWMRPALWVAAHLMRLWLASLRIHFPEAQRKLFEEQSGRLILFWHNRIFISPELRRRFCRNIPINGLVSASKDGAWLSAFFRKLGVSSIRGSSSWRGGVATLEILRKLKECEDVAITPDGPRGPCYHWKDSAPQIALKAACPVVLLSSRYHWAYRLKSWDGFYLPMPFSRVDLALAVIPPDDPRRALPAQEFSEELRRGLVALTQD
ncbi:MAG: DUF374 domain-containing protein [Puniceicoccales bacterium]|jgi:lysophospholipid acyltransferase (LPLAT)-like uncharacterized protein|nr:DUF374 domain-containing protein [Puniceicoccales bacterium]